MIAISQNVAHPIKYETTAGTVRPLSRRVSATSYRALEPINPPAQPSPLVCTANEEMRLLVNWFLEPVSELRDHPALQKIRIWAHNHISGCKYCRQRAASELPQRTIH